MRVFAATPFDSLVDVTVLSMTAKRCAFLNSLTLLHGIFNLFIRRGGTAFILFKNSVKIRNGRKTDVHRNFRNVPRARNNALFRLAHAHKV